MATGQRKEGGRDEGVTEKLTHSEGRNGVLIFSAPAFRSAEHPVVTAAL